MKFTFKNPQSVPYGHKIFVIDHYHKGDPSMMTVWLRCVNDATVVLNRYVNMADLLSV